MGQFDDFYKFRFKCFYTSGETPGKYLPRPGFTESLANYLTNNANVLSRKDVGIDIPNVIERRYVEMSSEHFRQYKEFEKTWYHDFLKDLLNRGLVGTNIGKLETEWATVAQNYLYQLAIGYPKSMPTFKADHKLNELSNLVTDELKNEKIVIWCYHKRDIEEIRQHFLQEKFDKTRVISGETDTTSLHYILQEFKLERKHGGIQYIIAQIGKAGMGLDLSASDTQIFFSRSWSSLQNEQASNRLIKLGKTGILTIELVTKNTVDEDLHRALLDKRANSNVYKWFLQRTKFESPEKVTV
jgi:superfamily II DNA or RNA helicase